MTALNIVKVFREKDVSAVWEVRGCASLTGRDSKKSTLGRTIFSNFVSRINLTSFSAFDDLFNFKILFNYWKVAQCIKNIILLEYMTPSILDSVKNVLISLERFGYLLPTVI